MLSNQFPGVRVTAGLLAEEYQRSGIRKKDIILTKSKGKWTIDAMK